MEPPEYFSHSSPDLSNELLWSSDKKCEKKSQESTHLMETNPSELAAIFKQLNALNKKLEDLKLKVIDSPSPSTVESLPISDLKNQENKVEKRVSKLEKRVSKLAHSKRTPYGILGGGPAYTKRDVRKFLDKL